MKLIDRYIYAVTKHLPEDMREDVAKELQSNIEDMLPENPSEEEVYQVLQKLGNPWNLANEYKPQKKYLIGPGYYDQYISTLKLVIGICVVLFALIGAISNGVDMAGKGIDLTNYSKLFSGLISSVVEGAIQGALWVTLVFAILERSGVESGHFPFSGKDWTPKDLPELPMPNQKLISRKETVGSMCFTIFFTVIFCFKPELIAIYIKNDSINTGVTPLFNIDRLQLFIPFILLLALMQLVLFVWKYLKGSWNVPLAIANTVYNVASCIILTVMVTDKTIFNQKFYSVVSEIPGSSSQIATEFVNKGVWIFIAVLLVICIWDSVKGFLNSVSRSKN